MCTARLFSQGVDLFAVKFYLDRVVPINHSWYQKTRDTGLPDSEDYTPRRSLVLIQYWSVTDRRTDGGSRICGSIQRSQSYQSQIIEPHLNESKSNFVPHN